jgi:hypothetical protein
MNAGGATLNALLMPPPFAFLGESRHLAKILGEGQCWWVCGSVSESERRACGVAWLKYASAFSHDPGEYANSICESSSKNIPLLKRFSPPGVIT